MLTSVPLFILFLSTVFAKPSEDDFELTQTPLTATPSEQQQGYFPASSTDHILRSGNNDGICTPEEDKIHHTGEAQTDEGKAL